MLIEVDRTFFQSNHDSEKERRTIDLVLCVLGQRGALKGGRGNVLLQDWITTKAEIGLHQLSFWPPLL